MKAVLALVLIYVGTFLVAIQGASNSPVEASNSAVSSIDPVKEKNIRSLLELLGANTAIQESASAATEQYRQKVVEASTNNNRAQAYTNAYLAEFQKKFDANSVNEQMVAIYDQGFSEDEIKSMLEFYSSPAGRKVAAEMPHLTLEAQSVARRASAQAAQLAWQDLRTEYPTAGQSLRTANSRNHASTVRSVPATHSISNQQIQADASQP